MHHHFSDDDEEEEENEAMADIEALANLPPLINEQGDAPQQPVELLKPQYLPVEGPNNEDLTEYFDKSYVAIERILYTTLLFPVIHPRQAKQVRGRWQEDCLKVVNVLINFRKNNICLGIVFAE